MSSAMNHRKRSHRSEYRARAFQAGRVSVIKPSVHKSNTFDLMRLLRKARGKERQSPPLSVVGEVVEAGESL